MAESLVDTKECVKIGGWEKVLEMMLKAVNLQGACEPSSEVSEYS